MALRVPLTGRLWLAIVALFVVVVLFGPLPLAAILHNLLGLWNFALLILVAATLSYFFYRFFLRRILRARRIANIRLRRMLEETGDARRKP